MSKRRDSFASKQLWERAVHAQLSKKKKKKSSELISNRELSGNLNGKVTIKLNTNVLLTT